MRLTCFSLIAFSVLSGARLWADFIAYDNAANPGSLQNYGSNLGLDFNVVSATGITVTQLGVFDNGDPANLNGVVGGGIDVGIFDLGTSALVLGGFTAHFSTSNAGTQTNGDAFLPVTNFLLPVGSYSIVAFNDGNYNSNSLPNGSSTLDTSGLITFGGGGRYAASASSLGFPPTPDGGPANRYDAGTFQFVAVPEPGSVVLFGLGFVGLWMVARRRRQV